MSGNDIQLIRDYCTSLLNNNPKLYHNLNHTQEVVESALLIADAEAIDDKEKQLLEIACWFHDTGYVKGCEDHEISSSKIAEDFLLKNNFSPDQIESVKLLILATAVPQKPKNTLEKIICDADLNHLGSQIFQYKNELLRAEFENTEDKVYSDIEWLQKNIDFFNSHNFFTDYAHKNFEPIKIENLINLQKKYRKKLRKNIDSEVRNEKVNIEKEKLKNKKNLQEKPERGIETMFRVYLRAHIELSAMADNKANILISVNAILLSIIVTILFSNISSNPQLMIPTFILSGFSLATIISGILVTLPKISSGLFSREEIKNKKANLLFFGNFYKANIDDFYWGMNELLNDKDYLYGSMIKDFYYLGQVLGKKYKYLRVGYYIFMFGLIISVISFFIAILTSARPTELYIK